LKRPLKLLSREDAEKERDAIFAFGAQIILFEDPLYPSLLRHIDAAPPLLTIKGKTDLLQTPLFALIGARNASALGKKMAYIFARDLGQNGWSIVSGLARGIDAAAHQGRLATGTLAVIAGGIDQVYPLENQNLHTQIAQEGLLIAESPFGTAPQATLFPKRNRLISGLSRGILIVEAALKSGSLLTATHALDQGRDVFVVPGHPLDPRARGCNKLIKNGAILVETLEDITQEISPLRSREEKLCESPPPVPQPSIPSSSLRKRIHENLSFIPIHIDELVRECQLQITEVWSILLEMELAGRLERTPGGKVALKKDWKSE